MVPLLCLDSTINTPWWEFTIFPPCVRHWQLLFAVCLDILTLNLVSDRILSAVYDLVGMYVLMDW